MVGQASRLQWEAMLVGAHMAPGPSRLAGAIGLSHAPRCYQLSFAEEQASTMTGKDFLLPPGQALLDERWHPMHGQDLLLPPGPALLDE